MAKNAANPIVALADIAAGAAPTAAARGVPLTAFIATGAGGRLLMNNSENGGQMYKPYKIRTTAQMDYMITAPNEGVAAEMAVKLRIAQNPKKIISVVEIPKSHFKESVYDDMVASLEREIHLIRWDLRGAFKKMIDEADLGLTHKEATKAIWAAKLSTQFIRNHFPLSEDTDQVGQIRRFYLISPEGINAIQPYI